MFNKFVAIALIACLMFTSIAEAGKGGGGSGRGGGSGFSGRSTSTSRSSMPSSSRPISSPSRPSTTSRSAPSGMKPSAAPSKPSTSTTSRNKPSGMTGTPYPKQNLATPSKPVTQTQHSKPTATKSNVDNKVNKMVKVGNTNMTKDQAISKFKTENAAKYQSTYKAEPSTRPAHIPTTYSTGGNNYNITYNHNHGGYGYYGPSGAWIMYDVMRDAAMMSMLMNHHGYRDVVVTQPTVVNTDGVVVSQPAPVVVYRNGYTNFFVGFFFVIALLVFIIFAMKVVA